MDRISCIIFDLDGTLSKTNQLIFAAFNNMAVKYINKVFTEDEIINMFGPTEEVTIRKLVGHEKFSDAAEDFYSFYEIHHARMAQIHTGIMEILEFLKQQGILLAIFTGKGKRSTNITLEKLGIKKYFDLIVTGDDVDSHKPSAEGIRRVLKVFGLEPGQALMVGDSVNDIKAAQEAGVSAAAVLWDSYGKTHIRQMEVEYRFDNVNEFESWVKNIIPVRGIPER